MSSKVYLLLGPEEGNKDDEVRRIKKDILSSYPNAELVNLYATEDILSTLESELTETSLFASEKIITVRYAEEAKREKELVKVITAFLESDTEGVFLIILSSELFSPFRLNGVEVKTFYEEFDSDKIKWIKDEFRKYEMSISPGGIDELLYSIENNKAEMRSAIFSISSFYKAKGKKEITEDDVSSVLRRGRGENGYTLFSSIAEKNLENALLSLSSIALEDNSKLIGTLSVVLNEFKAAENAIEGSRAKKTSLDNYLKNDVEIISNSNFKVQKGIKNFRRRDAIVKACKSYSLSEIKEIISYLISSDVLLKASQDTKSVFETVLYNIIINKGREDKETIY